MNLDIITDSQNRRKCIILYGSTITINLISMAEMFATSNRTACVFSFVYPCEGSLMPPQVKLISAGQPPM